MDAGGIFVFASAGAAATLSALAARRDLGAPLRCSAPAILGAITALWLMAVALGVEQSTALAFAALAVTCGLIAEIDRRHYLIPDTLVAGLLCLALISPFTSPSGALIGAALLGAMFLGVRETFARAGRTDALGLGDVKLAAAIGALLGPQQALLAVALAGLATLAVAAPAAMRGRASAANPWTPFGIGLATALVALAAFNVFGAAP